MILGPRVRNWVEAHGAELRLWLRTMVAGMATFGLAEFARLPQGYWAVLTAIIIMQTSVGGSVKATIDRMIGTLSGAVYGGAVAFFVPHATPLGLGAALTLALAPLTLLSALDASFRIAPVTAIIVLMTTTGQHLGPLVSALDRTLEIGLGCVVGLTTALLVLPARAQALMLVTANGLLGLLADLLPALLSGLESKTDGNRVASLQASVRRAMADLEKTAREARQERRVYLTGEIDPDPLLRSLLRLRHDLVMIGRADQPLPEPILERLRAPLAGIAQAVPAFMRTTGGALIARRNAPPMTEAEQALDMFNDAMAAIRRERLTRDLPGESVEQIYAIGFALAQLRSDLKSLMNRTDETAA
jgi:uncharacterized membrane protein YccC